MYFTPTLDNKDTEKLTDEHTPIFLCGVQYFVSDQCRILTYFLLNCNKPVVY